VWNRYLQVRTDPAREVRRVRYLHLVDLLDDLPGPKTAVLCG
jgi:hypothetical protein